MGGGRGMSAFFVVSFCRVIASLRYSFVACLSFFALLPLILCCCDGNPASACFIPVLDVHSSLFLPSIVSQAAARRIPPLRRVPFITFVYILVIYHPPISLVLTHISYRSHFFPFSSSSPHPSFADRFPSAQIHLPALRSLTIFPESTPATGSITPRTPTTPTTHYPSPPGLASARGDSLSPLPTTQRTSTPPPSCPSSVRTQRSSASRS